MHYAFVSLQKLSCGNGDIFGIRTLLWCRTSNLLRQLVVSTVEGFIFMCLKQLLVCHQMVKTRSYGIMHL